MVRDWTLNCSHSTVGIAPRLLVLCGTNGVGKTMLLRGAWRYLRAVRVSAWEKGFWPMPPSVRFALWDRYANLDRSKEEEDLCLRDLEEAEILLLDDVGAEADRFRSGLALSNLTTLLSAREGKWTALTTNYLPESWIGTDEKPGRFGRRAGDRLFRNSVIVVFRLTKSWALRKRSKP